MTNKLPTARMNALSCCALSIHLTAVLLATAAPLALHAEPGRGEPARHQSAGIHGATHPSESPSNEQLHADEVLHNHASPATAGTAPEGGWASDAPLRQGMQAILVAVVAAVRDAGEGKRLASELRVQIRYLFANCKLEPQADVALHVILAELLQSAQRLESGASATEEHGALHSALKAYGQGFQHPGWPIK